MNVSTFPRQTLSNPIAFEQYLEQWREKNALPLRGLDKIQRRYRYYSKYNWERHERVESEWEASEEFIQTVQNVKGPLTFVYITDDWCIDSAYSLPMLHRITAIRGDITLQIGLKDEHLELLDQFLTNGARSIPKLIILDEIDNVLAVWGPQPETIRLIRKKLIDEKAEGSLVSSTTVEWYANHGIQEVEKELTQLFSAL